MNKRKPNYIKLMGKLIANDKRLLMLSSVILMTGFCFLFTITALSETIVRTKQENTVKTYGKFLVAIPEIDEKTENRLKQNLDGYIYEHYDVIGTVDCSGKKLTMGVMEASMGDTLGFRLKEGVWPQTSEQIAVEEYVLYLLGLEGETLPVNALLEKEGTRQEYEITGILSNYSSYLSACHNENLEIKMYPSILCGEVPSEETTKTLVIRQKELDFSKAGEDILQILDQLPNGLWAANEKLEGRGYRDNADMLATKTAYLLLLNVLLVLEQVLVIRVYLQRNKKTLSLLEALGLSRKEKQSIVFCVIQGFIWLSLVVGYVLAALLGEMYVKTIFEEYSGYYSSSLHSSVLTEVVIAAALLCTAYFMCCDSNGESIVSEMNRMTGKNRKKALFKKLDAGIIGIETICILFAIAAFGFMNTFRVETEDTKYSLYSKITKSSLAFQGYTMLLHPKEAFSFDSLEVFSGYEDEIRVSASAETWNSTILFDKNSADSYFLRYKSEELDKELRYEEEAVWKQVCEEAQKYKTVKQSDVRITVLPQKDFLRYLKDNDIDNSALENNEERTCILCLPGYSVGLDEQRTAEPDTILLGGIRGEVDKAEFHIESFIAEAIIDCDKEKNNRIQIIMSEEVAKKSKTVVGYDTISITVNQDASPSVQKAIEQKVSALMASVQGGRLDSSITNKERNILMKQYTLVMSNTMWIFCVILISMYIVLNVYIDWEKYRYEYAVLRSFGMSYATLQRKLFLKYGYSIAIAAPMAYYFGKAVMGGNMPTGVQILISIGITIVVTCICRAAVYFWKKKEAVSMMLGRGN